MVGNDDAASMAAVRQAEVVVMTTIIGFCIYVILGGATGEAMWLNMTRDERKLDEGSVAMWAAVWPLIWLGSVGVFAVRTYRRFRREKPETF